MAQTHSMTPSLLKDTLETVWGLTYPKSDAAGVYKKYLDEKKMSDAWVDDQEMVGPGLLQEKQQGANIELDNAIEGTSKRYTARTLALRLDVAEEIIEDNKYEKAVSWTEMLADVAAKTPDYEGALILDRAFNSSYTGTDGLEMCSTAHLFTRGGTWSNELSTPAALSETALEDIVSALRKIKNPSGLTIGLEAKRLIVPSDLEARARRYLKSSNQADTANNAINAIRDMGMFESAPVVVPFMSSTSNWFVKTNAKNGGTVYWRRKPRFKQEGDFTSEVQRYKVSLRYDMGWTDPRWIFGSAA